MKSLGAWLAEIPAEWRNMPWLVLGKGPTFSHRDEVDLSGYRVLGLNHVVAQQAVDVAHVIDLDVVDACGEQLYRNAGVVVMPRVPHVRMAPTLRWLDDFLPAYPVLQRLEEEGRLVWYNASSSDRAVEGSPVVDVRYFSSEAAFDILGRMGVRTIRTLGIDGGVAYSTAFADLDSKTRLANGQPSFDLQFVQLDRTCRRWGIDFRALHEPLRVFVGCSDDDLLPAHVLAHSIRERSSRPVSVVPMAALEVPTPAKRENRPRTAFSFSRFAIPKLAGHHGRAVYLDSDMLVFGDIAELDELPFDGATVLCSYQHAPEAWQDNEHFHPGRQYSVMVLDCDRLDWDVENIVADLDAGKYTYEQLLFDFCLVPEELIADRVPSEWNHLERYDEGVTRNVHFTVVDTQPWRSYDNPLRDLWISAYREALAAGAVPPSLVRDGIERGVLTADLADHLDMAPAVPAVDPLAIELDATRERLKALEGRRLRKRLLRAGLRTFSPALELLRTRAPASPLTAGIDRAAKRARRTLS